MTANKESSDASDRWLRGIVPPVITPLTAEGALDVQSLERHVSRLLGAGVHGLFVLGSAGQFAYLDDATRAQVVETVVGVTAGQVPVLVGVIETSPARVRDTAARLTSGHDVAAIVCTAPYYGKTHRNEIEQHFRAVAATVDSRVVAYDAPGAVHTSIDAELVVTLARDGVVHGLKDSSGTDASARVIAGKADLPVAFSVLTGSELATDAALFAGVHGAVPGLSNVDPQGYVRLYDHIMRHEYELARQEQRRLVALFSIARLANSARMGSASAGIGGFKTALRLLGVIDSTAVPAPLFELDADEVEQVKTKLIEAGLL